MALKDITLGQYFPGNSLVHKLDPRTKLIAVVIYIVALFLAKWFVTYAIMFCLLALSIAVSKVPVRSILRGMKPVLFIAVVENLNINPDCDTDAGLAIANMTLAAWNRGVGSCIIGACNKPRLSEMFGLTEEQKLHTVVAFGYPSHKSRIEGVKDGDIRYYLDENRDYVVPKRQLEDVVTYM